MILSSPFSRQNRNHQSWTSNSMRGSHADNPKTSPTYPQFRSHTLNRLDLERSRQRQRPPLQRNLSSLGHHPIAPAYTSVAPNPPAPIYASVSIASPSEYRVRGGDSHHYAATSYVGPRSAASESGKSGRESALGNLLERFGTLRRRAKWSRLGSSSRKSISTTSPSVPPPPPPAVSLDPEIYATCNRKIAAEEIYAEGLRAIDGNTQRRLIEHQLDESIMAEGETRTIIDEESRLRVDYQNIVQALINWINDELSQQRIIVKDLQDDLHDGQVLSKLVEKLHHIKLDIVEVTQNETSQRRKLQSVLDTINRILSLQARWARIRWSVEGIHCKNMVEIIHLLVTLAIFYRAPIRLEPNVRVRVLVVQKCQGILVKRSHEVQLTDSITRSDLVDGPIRQRDVFDSLVEFAPDKLALVKQLLVKFINRHLNKINISCLASRVSDALDPDQFSDGLLLVFLVASLEDYFVPLGNLFTATPCDSQKQLPDLNNNSLNILQTALEPDSYVNTQPLHKLHNVNVAFQLMEEAGVCVRDLVRAEDIVNGDLKSLLRVLYALFGRYKDI